MGQFDKAFDSVVGSTMRPGTRGTAKLVRNYGDRLISVRYRYSDTPPTRFTTVEIVVATAPWKVSPRRNVHVDVKSWEADLREKIRAAGGRWVPKAMRWRMRYDHLPGTAVPLFVAKLPVATAADIEAATLLEPEGGLNRILVRFNADAGARLSNVGAAHQNQWMAVVVEGKVISAPLIRGPIGREVLITAPRGSEVKPLFEAFLPHKKGEKV
jgi:hypothetical protein